MKAVVTTSTIRDTFLFISVACVFSVVTLFPGRLLLFKEKIVAEYRAIMTPMGVAYMPIKLNLWYNTEEPGQNTSSRERLQYTLPQCSPILFAIKIGILRSEDIIHVRAIK